MIKPSRAFTLLEVLLALAIATGMLVVVLFFYRQAARLRSEVLRQSESASTARMIMQQVSSDLRSARMHRHIPSGLIGGPNYLQFIKAELPRLSSWSDGANATAAWPATDLRWVGYVFSDAEGDTNATASLTRWEEPLLDAALPATDATVDPAAAPGTETNALDAWGDRPLMTEHLRYVRFRYWNGFDWKDTWDGFGLPGGVEISLGLEPLAPEAAIEDYEGELFRRVIYLPGSGSEPDESRLLDVLIDEALDGGEEVR